MLSCDPELKEAFLRIALALECLNRNVYRLTEIAQDAVLAAEKNKDAA